MYEVIKVLGYSHVVKEQSEYSQYKANYHGTKKALCGILKKGETLEKFLKRKEKVKNEIAEKNKKDAINLIKNTVINSDIFFAKGVYMLYLDDEIVHIGKSFINVIESVNEHYKSGDIKFDSFSIDLYEDKTCEEVAEIENKLIKKYSLK